MRIGRRAAHKAGEDVQGGPKSQPDYYYSRPNFVYYQPTVRIFCTCTL